MAVAVFIICCGLFVMLFYNNGIRFGVGGPVVMGWKAIVIGSFFVLCGVHKLWADSKRNETKKKSGVPSDSLQPQCDDRTDEKTSAS